MGILLSLLFTAAASAATITTPTVKIDSSSVSFDDDLDFKLLDTAITRQLAAYGHSISLSGSIVFGDKTYPQTILKDSLTRFQEIAADAQTCLLTTARAICVDQMNQTIQNEFEIYAPSIGNSKFTAYYSPDFYGSLTPTSRFTLPLYHNPGSVLASQFTREEIVFDHKLENTNSESAYVDADLFDLYGIQIEGGGRIHLFDQNGNESIHYLTFDGSNSKTLVFFSGLFQQAGYLSTSQLGYDNQHTYFNAHPEIQRTFYSKSPNYVYFKISEQEPEGINGIPLTENRSLAFDKSVYGVAGILSFIKAKVGTQTMTRFFLGQDVGSAINGEARADLYFGFGDAAREAAETLASSGQQYFLILK